MLTSVTLDGHRSEQADVYTFADGKTVRYDHHGDTALWERVLGTKKPQRVPYRVVTQEPGALRSYPEDMT